MSAWIVALLTEAYDRLPPPATHEERLAYFMRRKRDLEAGFDAGHRARDIHTLTHGFTPLRPFSDFADDPVIARLTAEDR
jgi:hypothetical protein